MFMLQLFYHLVPLYIPLYLHTVLGIPWSELGWVFALMLVPFVLIEYPAGILADTRLGDRTLLIAGFAITGLSFALIATITVQTSIIVILLILIATRVGAALVEAMVEGHFFRRVSEQDTGTVGVFRMMRPIGALIAPLAGSLFLLASTYQELFICMGLAITIIGMMVASAVRSFRPVRTVTHAEPEHV
jgi:MFS family permease